MYDITPFMVSFLGYVVQIATWCWNTLDNIKIFGFSLLDFGLTLCILGVVLNIMFSLVRAEGSREMSRRSNAAAKERSSNKGDE